MSENISNLIHFARFSFFVVLISACSRSSDIAVQSMKMELPVGQQSFSEELLSGELAGLQIAHEAIVGPALQKLVFSGQNTDMFIFIKGNGQLKADSLTFEVCPESIAIPIASDSFSLEIPLGKYCILSGFQSNSPQVTRKTLRNLTWTINARFSLENLVNVSHTQKR